MQRGLWRLEDSLFVQASLTNAESRSPCSGFNENYTGKGEDNQYVRVPDHTK